MDYMKMVYSEFVHHLCEPYKIKYRINSNIYIIMILNQKCKLQTHYGSMKSFQIVEVTEKNLFRVEILTSVSI